MGCDLPSPPIHLANGPTLSSRHLLTSPWGGYDCHEDDRDHDDDFDDDDDAHDDYDDEDEENISSWVFADVMRERAGRGRSGQT